MRRPLTIVALIVAIPLSLGAGVAGGNWATGLGRSERDRSAEAAERPCERAYVEVGPERLEGQRRRVTLTTVAELDQPSVIAFPPEGGAGIIGQRNGLVRTFDGRTVGEPVLDFSGDTLTTGDGGLLAAAVRPRRQPPVSLSDAGRQHRRRHRPPGRRAVAPVPGPSGS